MKAPTRTAIPVLTPAKPKPKCAKALPCPFCGAKAKAKHWGAEPDDLPTPYWSMSCPVKACAVQPMAFGDTEPDAVAAWNSRKAGALRDLVIVAETLLGWANPEAKKGLLNMPLIRKTIRQANRELGRKGGAS